MKTNADEVPVNSGHAKRIEGRKTMARVFARAATQDAIAHGRLDRTWLFPDTIRKSSVLGFEEGYDFAKFFIDELGLVGDNAAILPTPEDWLELTSSTFAMRLRGEMSSFLSKEQVEPISYFLPLMSGSLEFLYEKAAPMRPEDFAKQVEAVKLQFAARRSARETAAQIGNINLDEYVELLTLKGDRDNSLVDLVEKKATVAALHRRNRLSNSIDKAIVDGIPQNWTDHTTWTRISLSREFEDWWKDLSGDFSKLVTEHGVHGQVSAFKMPEPPLWSLNSIKWENPPDRMSSSDGRSGATFAGGGGFGGAFLGGASSYKSGMSAWAVANYLGLLKAVGGAAALGGIFGAVTVGGIWWLLKTRDTKVAAAYSAYVRDVLAVQIEKAAIEDFVARFAAYYDKITLSDDLKGQHALDHHMSHAVNRIAAANTNAYYDATRTEVSKERRGLKVV